MSMTPTLVLTLLGAILLLVGLLGGGFEVKELKIPRVGWAARIPALLAGSLLLLLGIAPKQPDPPPPSQGINVTIVDDLGDDQISEQVVFNIDGRNVGVINVNRDYPHASLRVHLAGPGKYSYMATANAHFKDNPRAEYSGVGQALIDVVDGQQFDIEGAVSGETWLVTLHESTLAAR
jgi:hypothetical protein